MRIKLFQNIIDLIRGKGDNTLSYRPCKKVFIPKEYTPPKHTYKHLISIQGVTGHSGSSAFFDLLSEYENVTPFGIYDPHGSCCKNASYGEIDFLRRYGGVFDLESAFSSKNSNIRDFKLKNFITLLEYSFTHNDFYNKKIIELTYEFIDSLVDFKLKTDTGCDENLAFIFKKGFKSDYANLRTPYLFEHKKDRYLYYLKNITPDEYVKLAREYIIKCFNTIESKDYLVLDAVLGEGSADFEKLEKYVGEYKIISSMRDPRDVYTAGFIVPCSNWVPHNPRDFVKWYKFHGLPYINGKHKNYKLVRFEDLILNYDKTVAEITEFLGLDESLHKHKKQYLNPEVSIKNVGTHKKCPDQEGVEYIHQELKEYCYEI